LSKSEKRKLFIAFLKYVNIDICVVSETRFKEGKGDESMAKVVDSEQFLWVGRDRKKQRSRSGDGGGGGRYFNP